MAMLEVKDLEVYYGMIQAIKGISFEVNKGEVIALIGANGAGKTTTLHTITGLLSPKKGSVMFERKDITKIPAHKIVSMGMAHVPEGRRVFADLSVYENLKLGAYTRKDKENLNKDLESIYERFPRLAERKNQSAGTLSGGEQQRAAIARAIVNKPSLIIADEPTGNLDPTLAIDIMRLFLRINEMGTTALIITHAKELVDMFPQRVITIKKGKLVDDSFGKYKGSMQMPPQAPQKKGRYR